VGNKSEIGYDMDIAGFRVGQKVYVLNSSAGSCKAPYVVAAVASNGKYVLSDGNGQAVKNGREVETDKLQAA